MLDPYITSMYSEEEAGVSVSPMLLLAQAKQERRRSILCFDGSARAW